ncbi:MAG: PKD domain-containing protein [Deltaproteobacteria bacterium]|nr:PKD domain-containing protein [Deltaproteobacteria bacterium]
MRSSTEPGLRRVLLAAALALAGCAHRFPLASTEPVQALAGVPVAFGTAGAVPEGTTVRWDFGDGTQASGARAVHAFMRAGHFTVAEIVTDSDGERRAQLAVDVQRRSPLMAVPPDAETALVFDHAFERASVYRALLAKGFSPNQLEELLERLKFALGFDVMDPKQDEAAGLAPDEGAAWVTFAEEPHARYLMLGASDDQKLDAAFRAVMLRQGATFADAPQGFVRAHTPDSPDDVLFGHDRGYLIVRVPGDAPEPPLALGRFAAAPADGLAGVAAVQTVQAQLPVGDVWAYRARSALVSASVTAQDAPVAASVQLLLASMTLAPDGVTGEALVAVSPLGRPAVTAFFQSNDLPTLPLRAPPGAALYLGFSGDLSQLLGLATRSDSGQKSSFQRDLADQGIDLRELLASLGDEGAVAGYFDAAEFYRALAETQIPLPRGDLLLQARVRDANAALSLAQRLLTTREQNPSARKVAGGTRLEATLAGHPAGAYVAGDGLLLTWGLRHLDDAIAPSGPRLQQQLQNALPADAFKPGRLVLYVDVATVLDQLAARQPVPGLSPELLMRGQLYAHVATQPLQPIRDGWLVLAPDPAGMRARFQMRLR